MFKIAHMTNNMIPTDLSLFTIKNIIDAKSNKLSFDTTHPYPMEEKSINLSVRNNKPATIIVIAVAK